MRMGLPRILTSDQGGEFRNEIDKNIMKLFVLEHAIYQYLCQSCYSSKRCHS